MTVSISQKVDLLYKQAFGVTKTDTEVNKSPSNESIPSPLLLRGDTVWNQANSIPTTAAAVSGIVGAYTGATAVQCTADNTTVPVGGVYPTWKTNLTNWIPSEFGATYTVQAWVDSPGVANPTLTGTQIFAAGSASTGEYYFNYVSGVLNFIGETIPAALTSSKVLYVVGYRYIGTTGVQNLTPGGGGNIGNLSITDTTISTATTNSNLVLSANGTGVINIEKDIYSNGNITTNDANVQGNLTVGGTIILNDINVESVSANSITVGLGPNAFSESVVYSTITNTPDANQQLYNITANTVSGADYVIISTDSGANSRQITKISAVIYGNNLSYNETSTMMVGIYLGDWTLEYDTNVAANVSLAFSPSSGNTMVHKMLITKYKP